jgi:hypothetical protein
MWGSEATMPFHDVILVPSDPMLMPYSLENNLSKHGVRGRFRNGMKRHGLPTSSVSASSRRRKSEQIHCPIVYGGSANLCYISCFVNIAGAIANCHCPLVRLTLITRGFYAIPPRKQRASQRNPMVRSEASTARKSLIGKD